MLTNEFGVEVVASGLCWPSPNNKTLVTPDTQHPHVHPLPAHLESLLAQWLFAFGIIQGDRNHVFDIGLVHVHETGSYVIPSSSSSKDPREKG